MGGSTLRKDPLLRLLTLYRGEKIKNSDLHVLNEKTGVWKTIPPNAVDAEIIFFAQWVD